MILPSSGIASQAPQSGELVYSSVVKPRETKLPPVAALCDGGIEGGLPRIANPGWPYPLSPLDSRPFYFPDYPITFFLTTFFLITQLPSS